MDMCRKSARTPASASKGQWVATTTAKFSESGDYILHVIANDYSGDGGGGFGCCWTTALMKVSVQP